MLQMKQPNWQLKVLMQLTGPDASRVYTPSVLYRMAQEHHPFIRRSTYQLLLRNFIEISAIRCFHDRVYINQLSFPPVTDIEAWAYYYEDGLYSLQTVLVENGIIQTTRKQEVIVVPSKLEGHFSTLDETYDEQGNAVFSVYGMPLRYFPPLLSCQEALISTSSPFSSFVPEKALLDWLLLHDKLGYVSSPPSKINIALLDIPKLYKLAELMKMRELLNTYLRKVFESAHA